MHQYFPASDAPFGAEVFERVQQTVLGVMKSQLAGRRLLEVEGPYGLGHKSFGGADRDLEETTEVAGAVARLKVATAIPLPMIECTFTLGVREVAAFLEHQAPFSLDPAVRAAMAVARAEDAVVFWGSEAAGLKGLLNMPGVQSRDLESWEELGSPVEDMIRAVGMLEQRGFLGPYALALSPARYDLLYRRYQEAAMLQIQHVEQIVTGGVIKAPGLGNVGGVLVAAGAPFASIVLGQDAQVGFVGPHAAGYELVILESLATRVQVPEAVAVLK